MEIEQQNVSLNFSIIIPMNALTFQEALFYKRKRNYRIQLVMQIAFFTCQVVLKHS